MLTAQDVTTAYKLILGREPESPAVVSNYVKHSNFDHLRATLLGSGEFAERLSRDPHLLPVPMMALTMSKEVRRYKQLVETVTSLGLPIWDMSVLVVGDEPANLADFFLDRRCRVTVAASATTTRMSELCLGARKRDAANITLLPCDFGAMESGASSRHDLVFGALSEAGSDAMRTWLDNAAECCSGSMILLCKSAPGRSEEVFVTHGVDQAAPSRTVATRKWTLARLRERFEHVYEPTSASQYRPTPEEDAARVERDAVFVASREALSLPSLEECTLTGPRPVGASVLRIR